MTEIEKAQLMDAEEDENEASAFPIDSDEVGAEAMTEFEEEEDIGAKAGASWYVIHTYSGYENKVCKDLKKRIVSMQMEDRIFQVLVPVEQERDITKGSKVKVVEKKIYPGYALIQMKMDDQSWYVVRNTPGVTGFVSPGAKPVPLPDPEVRKIKEQMGLTAPVRIKVELEVGQVVKIVQGALRGNQATVVEIDPDREKVKVLVSMFGRQTPADVDISQVEKLS